MRKVQTFVKNNGWEYSEGCYGEIVIKKGDIIASFTKYNPTYYSMLVEHVEAIPCTCSPLMIDVLGGSQGECLDGLDHAIERIMKIAETFLSNDKLQGGN